MSRYEWPRGVGRKKRDDDPAARAGFVARRRVEFDPEGALRASRTPREAGGLAERAPGITATNLWQPLGPSTVLGGQAEGRPRVSGRVNALCVHPDGQRIYAGSANGGVWYSNDGGDHWISVQGLATTNTAGIVRPAHRNAVGALHVDFGVVEGGDVLFVGTGEVGGVITGEPPDPEGGIGILVGSAAGPLDREAPNLVNDSVYRIVREPGGATIVAATRSGLYQRPPGGGVDVDWPRLASKPFDTLNTDCTDVLWTPANGGSPARLWVWVQEGEKAGLWVRKGTADFKEVAVDPGPDPALPFAYTPRRAALAASTPPTHIWVLNDRGEGTTPALFRVTNPATGAGEPMAHGVVGVPDILGKSGDYNIAIAVDPANANRVVLGGSYLQDSAQRRTQDGPLPDYDASIVVAVVAQNSADSKLTFPYTMIGVGVHADVHALVYSNAGTRLWTGCDGGVFRSDRPLRPAGFYARNDGLSIAESNYVAVHPRCEGRVIAGLQDNGLVARLSSGVWERRLPENGDGGGVVMNALNPNQWMGQYVQGDWVFEPPGGRSPVLGAGIPAFALKDDKDAAFYSMPASIAHVRSAPPAADVPISQTLVGTVRLWYSDNFGATWSVLPPLDKKNGNLNQPIVVCRWQSPDVAWALCAQLLTRYARTPGSHNGGGPGTWTYASVLPPGHNPGGKEKKRPPAPPSLLDSDVWTDIAVDLDPPPAAGQPPAQRGALGALYIGTIGHETKAGVDTLWWFDGTDKWHPTGLRAEVPAPVTAIVCRVVPAEVWVGTTVGVWRGVRTENGAAPPSWDWDQMVNGLPEAPVEDLALFSDDGLVLLRAAIASRGIWELRLDVPNVPELTYLRVHDDDLRHRLPTMMRRRDNALGDRSWHGSPDVRPRLAPKAVPPPTSLPWRRTTFPAGASDQLRRFQAALRSSTGAPPNTPDPRIVANGTWDVYFSEVLRDHGAPTVVAGTPVEITPAFWNLHMKPPHSVAEPWAPAAAPTEADLHELLPALPEKDRGSTSCVLLPRKCKVDVVVHHRGRHPVSGANVRVTLLRWMDPKTKKAAKPDDPNTWFTGNVPWTAAVNQVLNSDDGKTALAVGIGWRFVHGTTGQSHRITLDGQTLDATRAGIATFDLDLTGLKRNRVVLLVAVIRTGTTHDDDIVLGPATLEHLVLNQSNVAVRSLRIGP